MIPPLSNKKTILVDFDGVIHKYLSPWRGYAVIPDDPVEGAIDWLKANILKYDIQIYSSRSKSADAIIAMQQWLQVHGMTRTEVSNLKFPIQKPAAFLTIDDRAFCFEGKFPSDDFINKFTPWNKI